MNRILVYTHFTESVIICFSVLLRYTYYIYRRGKEELFISLDISNYRIAKEITRLILYPWPLNRIFYS